MSQTWRGEVGRDEMGRRMQKRKKVKGRVSRSELCCVRERSGGTEKINIREEATERKLEKRVGGRSREKRHQSC